VGCWISVEVEVIPCTGPSNHYRDGGKCGVIGRRINVMGIGVGCVVVAVIGGCRLWARLWLAEDMQCSIVIFAYVIVAVSMATNNFVAFVMYMCMLFVVAIITVVNVVGIVVMISDDGFVVGAVGSCAFLVVVSVIADSFARHGCSFAIACVCSNGTGCMKQLIQLVGQFSHG